MPWEICPECYLGLHHHCIGSGCYCDCQLEELTELQEDPLLDEELYDPED